MEILSIALLALVPAGIGSAWFRFRSNLRSIQQMRSENIKAPGQPDFDVPEGCDTRNIMGILTILLITVATRAVITLAAAMLATTDGSTVVAVITKV